MNNKEASNANCGNERCKILRSLNRVFVFEVVLCIGAPSKGPARFVDLGFFILRNKEAKEYKSSSQETNHNTNPNLSPPISRTRGAHHRGQVLWQERPGTPLLLLVVATRGDPERVLGITPTHLYGAAPVPGPPLPAPAAPDGVHSFVQTQEVTAVTGVHLVRLPSAPPDDPRGPRALSPAQDWELWRDVWAAWLTRLPPQCQWMATDLHPHGAKVTASPPSPPPLPPAEHCTALPTEQHRCTRR